MTPRSKIGRRYGKLQVIKLITSRHKSDGGNDLLCRCDCGNESIFSDVNIHRRLSCGKCSRALKPIGLNQQEIQLFDEFIKYHGYVEQFCNKYSTSIQKIKGLSQKLDKKRDFKNKLESMDNHLFELYMNSDICPCDFCDKYGFKQWKLPVAAKRLNRVKEYSETYRKRWSLKLHRLGEQKRRHKIVYCDPIVIGDTKYDIRAEALNYICSSQGNRKDSLHRIIIENEIGRALTSREHVHHIDFNIHNNDVSNLLVTESSRQHHLISTYLTQILAQCMSKDDLHKLTRYLKSVVDDIGTKKQIIVESAPYNIPLYDNHMHLGGSIEPELIAALLLKHNKNIRIADVRKAVTYQGRKPSNFENFIKKFELLNEIKWTEEDVYDSIHQVVSKMDIDGVEGGEIRFSIGKYKKHLKMTDVEIIKFIKKAFDDASDYFNVKINLVLSFQHHANLDNIKVAYDLDKYNDCVVGIDVSGDEKTMDVNKFKNIYKLWKSNDKILMAHVGEQPGTWKNVQDAIEEWGVTRIAHGIYANKYTLDMAKDKDVCFDLAFSSNYYTGVLKYRHMHPALSMLKNGNVITLGTDDASVFCTSLRKEYALAKEYWGLDNHEINQLKLNALKYSSFKEIHFE